MEVSRVRAEFPALERVVEGRPAVFVDGPGGTQVPQRVIDGMTWYLTQANCNVGGEFITAQLTDQVIARAREAAACLLGADPDEVAFGQNMTTLCYALARALSRRTGSGDRVIITDLDHEANRGPWQDLAERGAQVVSIPLAGGSSCGLDQEELLSAIDERTRILAVTLASNAVGTVPRLEEAISRCREVGATVVVDAVHYTPHAPVDVKNLGADFLLCSAYKFFGPHIGILYGRREAFTQLETYRLLPQKDTPPNKIETGTLNHEGLAGVTCAVEFLSGLSEDAGEGFSREALVRSMAQVEEYGLGLARRLLEGLSQLQGVCLYGPGPEEPRTPTVSFTVEGMNSREVTSALAQEGIFAWAGDFYATTLVRRLGLKEKGGLIRIGFSPYNTPEEVDRILDCLSRVSRQG